MLEKVRWGLVPIILSLNVHHIQTSIILAPHQPIEEEQKREGWGFGGVSPSHGHPTRRWGADFGMVIGTVCPALKVLELIPSRALKVSKPKIGEEQALHSSESNFMRENHKDWKLLLSGNTWAPVVMCQTL